MPINSDGEEVNIDGSPVTEEQNETSDWTQVIALNQNSNVKPLSIDVLAPNTVPQNIPYLEVYRTDELYAKDYVSPFMTPPSSSTSGDSSNNVDGNNSEESSSDNDSLKNEITTIVDNHIIVSSGKKEQYINRLVKAKANWTNIAKIVNGHKIKGNATQDTVIRAILKAKQKTNSNSSSTPKHDTPHSSKTKNQKLENELRAILKNHYKSTTNFDVLVKRYMGCKTSKLSISIVNGRSSNNLKDGTDVTSMTNAILRVKKKYS